MPEFEWDDEKQRTNLLKHGFDFAVAKEIFDGRSVLTVSSSRGDEVRFASTGLLEDVMCTAIWTEREGAIRLISVRRARDVEERAYRSVFSGRD